jgi:ABC-type Na+ transport system ATPase subunit NatA
MYLIISSHILHEVDMMSDSVVLIHNGYVVAEGEVTACAMRSKNIRFRF